MDAKINKKDQLFILLKPDGITVSPGATFAEFMQLTLTATLLYMQDIRDSAEEDKRADVEQVLYDAYNQAAGNMLSRFAPELETKPDLTTEAILRAENEILNEATDEEFKELVGA